ncbi:synaptogenesis protein syg-2-like isoform X2 [Oratosquilla oratoria]|uniref:synaptogenesis protein syg-2-like isoform X2 n=1 Tax=Oratosquilla oratoria TaxID=337810 RepID=UPI003F76550E
MPCKIPPDHKGDTIYLILWHKKGYNEPIYSYDGREKVLKARSEATFLGGRADILPKAEDPVLVLTDLRENDEGTYTCRIDYRRKATRRAIVHLTVIVPPETPLIFDGKNGALASGVVGPYLEGDEVSLVCQVIGGRPSPNVTWYLDRQVIDDEVELTTDSEVRNLVKLSPLRRENLNDVFQCSASNNLVTSPASTSVRIDMHFPPLSVDILSSRAKLSAGKMYELTCRSVGARPAAEITWWLEGTELEGATSVDTNGGNETHSTLEFTPTAANRGQELVCRAHNPTIEANPIEDRLQLDILYKPMVELKYGHPEVNLAEGQEFFFECLVTAEPPVQKITWFHNGLMLRTNASAGVLESNHTLLLKNIQRHQAGKYSCVATNDEGEGSSKALVLGVKYVPVCATDEVRMVGAARQETVSLDCRVEANPDLVEFAWAFNSTSEMIRLEDNLFDKRDRMSTLNYTVHDDYDYGMILCWASNDLGIMTNPCKIHLIPAGPPDEPLNCTVTNQTSHTVNVACLSGYDGGLTQAFTMEVYDIENGDLAGNVTQTDLPVFTVQDLNAGASFRVMVYSANAKGRSKEVALHGFTLPSQEEPSVHIFPITPILGVLIGVIGALVIVAVVVVVVMRLRGDSNASRKMRQDTKRPTHKPLLPQKELEDNPDLIPSRTAPY